MILTGNEIERNVETGEISIIPFVRSNINPNSYNYRLGDKFIEINSNYVLDAQNPPNLKSRDIPRKGLVIEPNHLYLCNTYEKIGSKKFVTSLIGRSSIGRLGLYLQVAANLGHQGEIHQWTLEICSVKPVRIYPFMIIGQVTFWDTYGSPLESRGYYTNFNGPQISKGVG